MGFAQVSASHEVAPLIKIVPRGDTTVADAYLSPILRRYVEKVSARASPSPCERGVTPRVGTLPPPGGGDAQVLFMASSGGLKAAEMFRGRDAILSGPAGGVVGMAETAKLAGFDRVIGFDMGGTSTDVAHFAGEYERAFETQVAGVRLAVPMLRIHTVAAGGGSIIAYDGTRFRVGPESAGANPGPKCYRRGGPLTVTDANVMVGKLDAEVLPADLRARRATSRSTRKPCARRSRSSPRQVGDGRTPEEIADGAIRIAVENMANAIKKISVERGYDVTEYALNCFGSAGGQHACLIADTLGIETVLIHPLSGLLSAYGMGLAKMRASRERSIEAPLDAHAMRAIESLAYELGSAATEELLDEGVEHDDIAIETFVHLRYAGTDTALPVLAVGARHHAPRLRGAAPAALRLRVAGEGHRRRRPRGRGAGRRGEHGVTTRRVAISRRGAAERALSDPRGSDTATRFYSRGGVARGAGRDARGAAAGRHARRPGARHRAASDGRRRAGLEARR